MSEGLLTQHSRSMACLPCLSSSEPPEPSLRRTLVHSSSHLVIRVCFNLFRMFLLVVVSQTTLMSEALPTLRAGIRLLSCVCSLVCFQSLSNSECFLTHKASVRLLSCVGSHVYL
ncbi:hypothetical protein J4Q44_G00291850 [Coregonus suidteri]|uniref:Uncharacterized protein n=1 Tax=Coregonus suidteri TaxID=861788 RepID=A0AAN8QTD6_9TELE